MWPWFNISDSFAKELDERLKYKVLVECPELDNYFQLSDVEIIEKYKVADNEIYVTAEHTFLRKGQFGYSIAKQEADHRLVIEFNRPIKQWRFRTKDIWLNGLSDEMYSIIRRAGKLDFRGKFYYYALIKDKYYISYEQIKYEHDVDIGNLSADLFKKYLKRRRRTVMRRFSEKYGFRFREYNDLNETWKAFKAKYKSVKEKLKNNIERGIASKRLSEAGLRDAGWSHYDICEPIEPSEPIIEGDFAITLIRLDYAEIVIKMNGVYITRMPVDRLPEVIRDLIGKKVIRINDGRVIKHLKYNPGFLRVSFAKIPYFKWAVNKLFENLKADNT